MLGGVEWGGQGASTRYIYPRRDADIRKGKIVPFMAYSSQRTTWRLPHSTFDSIEMPQRARSASMASSSCSVLSTARATRHLLASRASDTSVKVESRF